MHDLQELSLHNKGDDGSDKKVFHIIGKIHQFFRISLFRALFRTSLVLLCLLERSDKDDFRIQESSIQSYSKPKTVRKPFFL